MDYEHLPHVVGIVGGTGGHTFARAFLRQNAFVTTLCCVCDEGGSTGRLYREFGDWFAQGDIRNCMEAMIPPDKPALKGMLGLVFDNGNGNNGDGLGGHKFGNTAILAAQKWGEKVLDSPVAGLRQLCRDLGMRGEVLPISADRTRIIAELMDGGAIIGESAIDTRGLQDLDSKLSPIRRIRNQNSIFISPEAYEAILKANLIVIGPGDLFTSIVPSLIVDGVPQALKDSKAKLVFVINLMTKRGETDNYLVQHFVDMLFEHGIGRDRIDAIIVSSTPIPIDIATAYYDRERSHVVLPPPSDETFGGRVKNVILSDLLSQNSLKLDPPMVRHGSGKLGKLLMSLARESLDHESRFSSAAPFEFPDLVALDRK